MKKHIKEIQGKSIKDVEQDIKAVRTEIANMIMQKKVNPQKDTNAIVKKRKQLAVLLTIHREKK